MHRPSQRGFSLIELMVTVAIIAIMLAIGVPSFGNSVRASRERSVVQRMTQDFQWARTAAATQPASGATGPTSVQMTIAGDCSWSTKVNGVVDSTHSMDAATVTRAAPGVACGGIAPATFTFTPQGFVDTTGQLTFSGSAYSTPLKFQILSSGAMFRSDTAT
jgi:type IV fimbrial biogenesis protein FimT